MDPDDILRRAYARLVALRENLPEASSVSEDYVEEFHDALFDLECLDYDVVPFHVRPQCVRPSKERILSGLSAEKYVERAMLLTKISAVLVYFDLSQPTKEPAEIGFSAARRERSRKTP